MDQNSNPAARAVMGGERILRDCLQLKEGEHIAVFWDKTTSDVAGMLREAAGRLNLVIEEWDVPIDVQYGFRSTDLLPSQYLRSLSHARATISCLTDDPRGTNFRKAIIENALRNSESRMAHMPGATTALLEDGAAVELAEAERLCDYLGAVLSLGRHAVLETYELGPDGRPFGGPDRTHRLAIDLGGMGRMPIMSPGVIAPGTWGNVPGGETFIAPMEGTAEGTFVLNGAFTGHVIELPCQLLLRFRGGRMCDVDGDSIVRDKFLDLLSDAEAAGDRHCRDLAELGIGVNRGIQRLIGRSLSDEKVYGTIHIAVGDSKRFGGLYESAVHEDVVTMGPSLWVDGSPIVVQGRLVFDYDQWQDRLDVGPGGVPLPACEDPATHWVSRTSTSATTTADGRLRMDQEIGAGRNRRCTYTVGEPRASQEIARVYAMIPEVVDQISMGDLMAQAASSDLDEQTIRRALRVLIRHHLVEIRE
jgi:hypothetical protein